MLAPRAYYNEIDPYASQWLFNLQKENLIAPGDIDTRPIQDVRPNDLRGYTQHHFFAGLGGWSRALRLAHWPDHRKVWTGSCPCQPFSAAGKRLGFADDRHLWPYWRYLIAVAKPSIVFGEQVASAAQWLKLVRGDLEALDYAVGCCPVEAASAGADHLRDRYWFVAHSSSTGFPFRAGDSGVRREAPGPSSWQTTFGGGAVGDGAGFAQREPDHQSDADADGRQARSVFGGAGADCFNMAHPASNRAGRIAGTDTGEERAPAGARRGHWNVDDSLGAGQAGGLPNTFGAGLRGQGPGEAAAAAESRVQGADPEWKWLRADAGPVRLPEYEWVIGADGKARRVEPGVRLLAHDVPNRVAKLRAFGNAIVPPCAQAFIEAYLDALTEEPSS